MTFKLSHEDLWVPCWSSAVDLANDANSIGGRESLQSRLLASQLATPSAVVVVLEQDQDEEDLSCPAPPQPREQGEEGMRVAPHSFRRLTLRSYDWYLDRLERGWREAVATLPNFCTDSNCKTPLSI